MTRYTFAVYVTAPEPVDAEDVDGYSRKDVEGLLKLALTHPTSPIHLARPAIRVDWELMDDQVVAP